MSWATVGKGYGRMAALYEGKMVQAFDHRAASISVNLKNLNRPAQPEPSTLLQHRDPAWSPSPQFWVAATDISVPEPLAWMIAFKDITSPTNMRTMIAAAIPRAACSNKLPIFVPDTSEQLSRTHISITTGVRRPATRKSEFYGP